MTGVNFKSGEGQRSVFRYTLTLDLKAANVSRYRSLLCFRHLEFWCQMHCIGSWSFCETMDEVTLKLHSSVDAVHFKLSPEFVEFEQQGRDYVVYSPLKRKSRPNIPPPSPTDFK